MGKPPWVKPGRLDISHHRAGQFILVEGNAEAQYLLALRTEVHRITRTPFQLRDLGGKGNLIKRAVEEKRKISQHKPAHSEDQFWLVMDGDVRTEFSQEKLAAARKAGIRLIVTGPCFEAWLLAHVIGGMPTAGNSREIIEQLKRKDTTYAKSSTEIQKCHRTLQIAGEISRECAERYAALEREFGNDLPALLAFNRPFSQMHILMQEVFGIGAEAGS